ncbi:hypothetical protein ABZ929_26455 [Streptomyces physcomitrii]|uniref:hypothetical protein n=1 Tax=Streptomyces physcomitrii TaxID=2724184 RepID=UPI0034136649
MEQLGTDEGVRHLGWLEFGADGGFDRERAARTLAAVGDSGVEDLYVFVHGAHNDPALGAGFDRGMLRLLAEQLPPGAPAPGAVGVRWPSLVFRDEGAPGVEEDALRAERAARPALTRLMREDLHRILPDSALALDTLAELLADRPRRAAAFDDFGSALRRLAEVPLHDPRADYTSDTEGELLPQADPLMLVEDTQAICAEFTGALRDARENWERGEEERDGEREARAEPELTEDPSEEGTLQEVQTAGPRPVEPPSARVGRIGTVVGPGPVGGDQRELDPDELWYGAHELLRQVVHHVLRRRAGLVGQLGLGACLRELVDPDRVRIHLVGHGLGGRLAGFALRGLGRSGPGRSAGRVHSLTLLQAAMSHFAFSGSIPQHVSGHGALWEHERFVEGSVVCCFSRHDLALGLMHPLAAQMAGDSAELSSVARKWGAAGFDGLHGLNGTAAQGIDAVVEAGLPDPGIVNVDASSLVRRGDPATGGAHHDVLHPAVAALLLRQIPA